MAENRQPESRNPRLKNPNLIWRRQKKMELDSLPIRRALNYLHDMIINYNMNVILTSESRKTTQTLNDLHGIIVERFV